MTGVVFHPSAEQELMEAAKFYETRAVGLGGDYIREVEHTLAQIVANSRSRKRICGDNPAPAPPTVPVCDFVPDRG